MAGTDPVYLLIQIQVTDAAVYAEYVEAVESVVTSHGGRYLVRGGETLVLSGTWDAERIIIIEFGSIDGLRACFGSPEYAALAPLREKSTISRVIVLPAY